MGTTKEEQQLADPKLLEKIDKLFELNIGEYVDLPQVSEPSPTLPMQVLTSL